VAGSAEVVLPPTTASVAEVRRFVGERLAEWPHPEVAHSAMLAASELATNAVLHARTEFTVKVMLDDCVRIEIEDRSPALPVLKPITDQASTGRGLHLVERLTDAWGVEASDGKRVWCELSRPTAGPEVSPMEVDLDAWLALDDAVAAAEGDGNELVDVWLLRLPLDVYRRAQEHSDGLARELLLIASAPAHAMSVPARLWRLIGELAERYRPLNPAADRQLRASLDQGEPHTDVLYRVPPRTKDDVQALDALLREADEHCRRGESLLTLPTPPEAEAFREWVFGEIARQIDGEAPRPWPGFEEPRTP
jgi:anti-sigma regulatory factor (Ser/Thr protein kinase)